jgi:aminoglycoside phosphotransferase family enzyme/predicted kinase
MQRPDATEGDLPDALGRPAAYPHDASARAGVEVRQTHISHLFLTRDRVYKVRKAVDLPFLSFGERAARNADCEREISLNRRLAPDVYLGLAPILPDAANGFVVGPIGEKLATAPGAHEPAEHCVVMRRLPTGRDALSLLEGGRLTGAQVDRLARLLARFHERVGLGRPSPWSDSTWLERIAAPTKASFQLARTAGGGLLDVRELEYLDVAMRRMRETGRDCFESRRAEGRAVDGHGDLHLDAVWFETDDAEPVVIDCLEFDAELRRIDVAAELAFFAMDAAYRGRADLGERLLGRYAALTDDYALYGVVDYHILHRALVRAGVAALAATGPGIVERQRMAAADSARRHIAWMREWLERPTRTDVFLMTGLSGTGKSTVAAEVADMNGAVVVASDRVRKHLARKSRERPESLYSAAMTHNVYAGLLARAVPVLGSGRPVVLDATYALASHREAVRRACAAHGWRATLVDVRCDEATALDRIERRLADPDRISDADSDVHRAQRDHYQPADEWSVGESITVHTDRSDWRTSLRNDLERRSREDVVR